MTENDDYLRWEYQLEPDSIEEAFGISAKLIEVKEALIGAVVGAGITPFTGDCLETLFSIPNDDYPHKRQPLHPIQYDIRPSKLEGLLGHNRVESLTFLVSEARRHKVLKKEFALHLYENTQYRGIAYGNALYAVVLEYGYDLPMDPSTVPLFIWEAPKMARMFETKDADMAGVIRTELANDLRPHVKAVKKAFKKLDRRVEEFYGHPGCEPEKVMTALNQLSSASEYLHMAVRAASADVSGLKQ